MLRYDVFHNGSIVARAGVRKGVLSAMVTWVSREAKVSPDELVASGIVPGLECTVGGLNTAKQAREEHVDWATLKKLRLGDEILVRISRGSRVDRPSRREAAASPRRRRKGKHVIGCSFCGVLRPSRRPSGAPGVALGHDGAICSQCLAVATALLEANGASALHLDQRHDRACSFCGRRKPATTVCTSSHGICADCIEGIGSSLW